VLTRSVLDQRALKGPIATEKKTVAVMVRLYCSVRLLHVKGLVRENGLPFGPVPFPPTSAR
jgi:hypothetical protein